MKKIVLVVDSDIEIRKFIKSFLEEFGFEVITCAFADEAAIKCLEEADVLVTGLVLIGTTGDQFAEKAKKIKPGIPVLILTSYPELVPDDHFADKVVVKPFDVRVVISWLEKVTG